MVQEIPERAPNEDKSVRGIGDRSAERLSSSSVAKHLLAALLLFSLSFLLAFSNLEALVLITLPAAVWVLFRLVAKTYSARYHELRSALFSSFLGPSATVSSFLVALAFVGMAYGTPSNPLVAVYLAIFLALVVVFNAIFLNEFGSFLLRSRERDSYKGLATKRVAGALGLFFLYLLASVAPAYTFLGDPFLFAAIAYGLLAIAPVLAYSDIVPRFRDSGQYLASSTGQWTAIAFLIGIAATILSLPFADIYTYVGVLILAMLTVGYIGLKMFNLSSDRLDKMQQEVYQKHVHQLVVVRSPDFGFLDSATDSFVSSGQKSKLLIALTTLLTNAGLEYRETYALLSGISSYEVPAIYRTPGLSLKKGLDSEVQRRIHIVNTTMYDISQRVGKRAV